MNSRTAGAHEVAESARFAKHVEERLPSAALFARLRNEVERGPFFQIAPRDVVERRELTLQLLEGV